MSSIRRKLIHLHRWLSLAAAIFWLLQAITGVILVFHWEIDDATVAGIHRQTDLAAIEARAERLAPPASARSISSIWTSASGIDRFDIFVDGDKTSAVVRVDGAGNVLRMRGENERFADGGLIDTLVVFHHNLLGGDFGSWIVGLSGLLLLSNMAMGLALAWPRRGTWRQALLPKRLGPKAARRYAWHRAVGLWGVIPALLSVSAGAMLVFESGTSTMLGAPPIDAPTQPPGDGPLIGMAQAARTALAAYPGSRVSGISFPSDDDATYRLRIRQPGEPRRAYGMTTVFVSAVDGRIIARYDALKAPLSRRFMDILFPFHTGEFGGTVGRVAVAAIGLWLITMIVIGISLWQARRKRARRSGPPTTSCDPFAKAHDSKSA